MTALVIVLSGYLAVRAGRNCASAAAEVGYPEIAARPEGRLRIALVSGGSTYAALAGGWLLVSPWG